MPVQNRRPCRLRTTAGSRPRLWRGAGGLRRARPRQRGRAPSAVPQPPFGHQPQPHPVRTVPPPSTGAPAATVRPGPEGPLRRAAPGRAFLRFAPEDKPHQCELKLFWTAMAAASRRLMFCTWWAINVSRFASPVSQSPISRNSAMEAGCLRRRLCHAQRKEVMDEEGGPFPPPPLAKPEGGTPTLGRLFRLRLKGPQSLIR
jgi:hypothetical protein